MSQTLNPQQHAAQLASVFEQKYGRKPAFAAAAPGRVNLIGEHTDYNDGFVLPMAIERHTVILAAPREDRVVQLATTAEALDDARFTLENKLEPGEPSWANYPKGVIAGFVARGANVGGFDALLASTVPSGGGLSSSASLEVSTATLLEQLTQHTLPPVDKALLAQQAEHDFAHVPCGIMDQFISAMGRAGHALLIDCRSYETRAVPLADPDVSVLIINSNVKHALVDGEYRRRREQCEKAAAVLGVKALRDATLATLDAKKNDMDETTFKRARHVITENDRTVAAADAMQAGQWNAMGRLMLESHASMAADYEITVKEIDLLVDLAKQHIPAGDVYGSRMTGGGFGGCTVTLVKTAAVDKVRNVILENYRTQTGIDAVAFATRPAAGADVIKL